MLQRTRRSRFRYAATSGHRRHSSASTIAPRNRPSVGKLGLDPIESHSCFRTEICLILKPPLATMNHPDVHSSGWFSPRFQLPSHVTAGAGAWFRPTAWCLSSHRPLPMPDRGPRCGQTPPPRCEPIRVDRWVPSRPADVREIRSILKISTNTFPRSTPNQKHLVPPPEGACNKTNK